VVFCAEAGCLNNSSEKTPHSNDYLALGDELHPAFFIQMLPCHGKRSKSKHTLAELWWKVLKKKHRTLAGYYVILDNLA